MGGFGREVRDQARLTVERIVEGGDTVTKDAAGDGQAGGDGPGGENGPFAAATGWGGGDGRLGHFDHFHWSRSGRRRCEVFLLAFAHPRLQALERAGGG